MSTCACNRSAFSDMTPTQVSILDIPDQPKRRDLILNKGEDMCYYSPASGCYGILRMGLMPPETHVLFVAPMGCGRHGMIGSYFYKNTNERIHALFLTEQDMVLGTHIEQVYQAGMQLIERFDMRALTIIYSCVDDLLGSDYDMVASDIEEQSGISVGVAAMNPIRIDSKLPPVCRAFRTVYRYIKQAPRDKEKLLLSMGLYANIAAESELHEVLASRGYKIMDFSQCETFDEFCDLGRCKLALVMGDAATIAADDLQKRTGMPYERFPVVMERGQTIAAYKFLEELLDEDFNWELYEKRADAKLEEILGENGLAGKTVNIGETHPYSTFELAHMVTQWGGTVNEIYTAGIQKRDLEHLAWLKEHAPQIKIMPPCARDSAGLPDRDKIADIGIGMDAAYYSSTKAYVPLDIEKLDFGFEGEVTLAKALMNPEILDESFEQVFMHSKLVI